MWISHSLPYFPFNFSLNWLVTIIDIIFVFSTFLFFIWFLKFTSVLVLSTAPFYQIFFSLGAPHTNRKFITWTKCLVKILFEVNTEDEREWNWRFFMFDWFISFWNFICFSIFTFPFWVEFVVKQPKEKCSIHVSFYFLNNGKKLIYVSKQQVAMTRNQKKNSYPTVHKRVE